jgi:hypothetical protein
VESLNQLLVQKNDEYQSDRKRLIKELEQRGAQVQEYELTV